MTMFAGLLPGWPRRRRPLTAIPLLALLMAAPSVAQMTPAPGPQDAPQSAPQNAPQNALQTPGGGVVTPPPQVDRGMIRPTPDLPRQSTPVIHPRRLRKGRTGVQVVPK